MNFANKTYEQLMNLVEKDESFFFKDFILENRTYRIFNYNLASWTSFQQPGALNCRGTMFDVTDLSNVVLVSLPPEKFFNYEEGGVNHSVGRFGDKMVKMDGSLISTYLHNGELYLKSKGSLFSSQAVDSMKLINLDENNKFMAELKKFVELGYTVNLEYTSPENRIVIPYQEEKLTVLSARRHSDGYTFFATRLKGLLNNLGFNEVKNRLVDYESLHEFEINHDSFVEAVRKEQEGEGYVVEIVVGDYSYLTKLKNIKYVTLHQTKDSVNSPRRLFEAVIEEATDDLRAMFFDDNYVLKVIEDMENRVRPIYNHIIKTVDDFYGENKELSRKDYAIKAKTELPQYMGLLMNSYLGQENDYKTFAKKHRKDIFGVIEEEPTGEEDIIRKSPKI